MEILKNEYRRFYREISARIISARNSAARAIDKESVLLYWDIGKNIAEKQELHKWGDAFVKKLSLDLINEFGNLHGFSPNNLWRMKLMYAEFKGRPKVAQRVPLLA